MADRVSSKRLARPGKAAPPRNGRTCPKPEFITDTVRILDPGLAFFQGGKWLASQVVPLAFRRKVVRRVPQTEVRRTDGPPGS